MGAVLGVGPRVADVVPSPLSVNLQSLEVDVGSGVNTRNRKGRGSVFVAIGEGDDGVLLQDAPEGSGGRAPVSRPGSQW